VKTTYSVTEAQADFPGLVRRSADAIATIERHGVVQAYVIGRERMEAIAETLELLANPEFGRTLAQYRSGRLRMKSLASAHV